MNFSSSKNGALPSQTIHQLVSAGFVSGCRDENIRPSSLDLSLSDEVYQVEGVFQPRPGEKVRSVLEKISKKKFSFDKSLSKGQMYIARLNEKLSLPEVVYGVCNPKSTSGRLDIHVRLLADGVPRYDLVYPAGFKGELWVSIVPKTFNVKLSAGQTLNQLRFFNADTRLDNLGIEIAAKEYKLIWDQKKKKAVDYENIKVKDNDGSIILSIDLSGDVVGYQGVKTDKVIDLNKVGGYSSKDFFKPLKRNKKNDFLYLKSGEFYILSTLEAVRVPPELACEMLPMDERSGEFRSHYAGFIDPGWGYGKKGEGKGRPLTLEVRPFEDIIIRHGQPIGKIKFEEVAGVPEDIYDSLDSNYLIQSGPKLAKHFKN